MQRFLFLLPILLSGGLFSSGLLAQDPLGTWQGAIRLDNQYSPMTIRIEQKGGELAASLEIPSRDVLGLPLTVEVDAPEMRLEMNSPVKGRGVFDGLLQGGLFTGNFTHEIGGLRRRGKFQAAKVVELDREQLRRFEGVYEVQGLGSLKVFVLAQATGLSLQGFALRFGSQIPLFPVSQTEFIGGLTVAGDPAVMARLRFVEDEAGAIAGLTFERPGAQPMAGRLVDTRLVVDRERIESQIQRLQEAGKVPSYSVGIVQGDDLVYAESFGFADLESKEPATPKTLYQVGSLSKAFAATLFGILQDEGLVGLHEPVRSYLPEDRSFPVLEGEEGSKITPARLLTHTSGLPRDPLNRPDVDGVPAPYGVEDLYTGLGTTGSLFPVGQHWSYSNLGFGLLGHLLGRVGGSSFEALLEERVLEPLDMGDTSISLTAERQARLATHYWIEDSDRRPRPHWVFGEIAANGGVVSNVVDLAKFLSLQLKAGRSGVSPISGATLSQLHEPRRRRGGWNETIGLGWWIDHSPGAGTIVSHGGEVDGHSAYFAFSPRYQVGAIVLANLGGGTADQLGTWLMEEVVIAARAQRVSADSEASAWYRQGEWADAAAAYGRMAAARPGNAMAQYRHGVSLYRMHRYEEAAAALERALARDYAPALTHLALARIYNNGEDKLRAVRELEAAVRAGLDLNTVQRDGALRTLLKK